MDFQSFSRACEKLYSPGLGLDNYVQRCAVFLRALVPAEALAFALLQKREHTLNVTFDRQHADLQSVMEAFGALMGRYDLYNFDPGVHGGKPFCRSQFFSDRAFRDLDIYQEVYRPLGIDNHCAVHVPGEEGEAVFFGLERRGGPDFEESDLEVLSAAQPHLSNALCLARAYDSTGASPVNPDRLAAAGLTPREAETLFWISEGKTNVEIATLLGISLYTVKGYVGSIFDKAGVGNRLAAINWAHEVCNATTGVAVPTCPGIVTVPALLSA